MDLAQTDLALLEPLTAVWESLTLAGVRGRLDEHGPQVVTALEALMDRPLRVRMEQGEAVFYSHRCPTKETPNEDAAAIVQLSPECAVLIVADGCGGHSAGHVASRMAIETLVEQLRGLVSEDKPFQADLVRPALLDALEQANRDILTHTSGAATTLAMVEINANVARTYHVGDAAIMVMGQRGKLKRQTIAHSPVGYAVESGMMSEAEALHHEERHLVSNAVGATDMRMEMGSPLELAARDTLLVSSDGLMDNLTTDEIITGLKSGPLDAAVASIVELARSRMMLQADGQPSKPDDLTVIAYRGR